VSNKHAIKGRALADTQFLGWGKGGNL
jgi:hypothetical protein